MSIKKSRWAAVSTFALFNASLAMAEMGAEPADKHVINLDRVELSSLIDDVSIITGYTFVLHPDVGSTKVTVRSQTPVTSKEVFQIFLSTLRVHGFAAVPSGRGVYRILPEKEAVGQAATTGSSANAFITEVVKLDRFDAVEAAQMVKPLIDPQGQVVANSTSNTLVLVDYASNMPRLRQVVDQLDGADKVRVEVIALEHTPARELESMLLNLLGSKNGENGKAPFEVSASLTSNSIVVKGDNDTINRALQIATELDQPKQSKDTVRIIPLKNASAEEIIPVLESLTGAIADQNPGNGPLDKKATIAHHQPTNTLVLSADPETLLSMERVVEALDERRAQVLVEAIIVEMSDDKARELGVQFLVSGTGNSTVPFLSTNFSRSVPNLLGLAGVVAGADTTTDSSIIATAATSALAGTNGVLFGAGGQDGDTLFGAILNALEEDTNSKVLSKPFNTVMDNGESELLVGQEVPVTTGLVLDDGNTNPFQTFERKEVGITLQVSPRIAADDTIQLDIYQEVSSVIGATLISESGPTFNTRKIDTRVLADDGEIIVLGGLIEQADTIINSKVPGLGDIPVVGNLFKSEGREVGRTNLMVFIKPTIIRDQEDSRFITEQNYNRLIAEEFLREGDDQEYGIDQFFNSTLGQVPSGEQPPDIRY